MTFVAFGLLFGAFLVFVTRWSKKNEEPIADASFQQAMTASSSFTRDERWSEALDALDRVDRNRLTRSEVARLNSQRAYCLLRVGNPQDAIVAATLALQLDESRSLVVATEHTLGVAYLAVGRLHDALELLERTVLEPLPSERASSECWHSLGEALIAVGRIAEAHEALRKAVNFDPGGPWANRAEALLTRDAYR